MKTAVLLLTLICCGALAPGADSAAEPSGKTARSDSREGQDKSGHSATPEPGTGPRGKMVSNEGKHSTVKADSHHLKPGTASLPNLKLNERHPAELASHSSLGNGLHPPTWHNAPGAIKAGPPLDQAGNHFPKSAKLPVAAAASNRAVLDREATTAKIGGLAAANVKNSAGAINGFGIKRKP